VYFDDDDDDAYKSQIELVVGVFSSLMYTVGFKIIYLYKCVIPRATDACKLVVVVE